MYTEKNVPGPEYRVRPVVRYVVTRYCHPYTYGEGGYVPGGSEVIAEVPGEERANEIAEAMKKIEDEWLGKASEKMETPADSPQPRA